MSTTGEDGTAKSKKNPVKVNGGEFGGIAGIVVLGGVVAVGVAAGAIAFLRKSNTNRNRFNKDENHQISSQKSPEICSYPHPNECLGREETELIAPSSENGEETEQTVEIVESLSDLDISPDWKNSSKSKEEGSPRSHFSRKTSIASTSSDSEDVSEISRNNYIRDAEIDSSRLNLKESDFYFVPTEETTGEEASSSLRECVPVDEVHISSLKQSVDPKFEYEESVDSCDGLQGECEEVGSSVELGGFVAEQLGEKKLDVFDGWEGITKSEQCILDCAQTDGTVVDNGNKDKNRVSLEEVGVSLCIEPVHEPLERVNTDVSEDLQRKDVACKEIGSMQNCEAPKEDTCLEEKEIQLQKVDSEQDIALFEEEQLENIGSSEVLNCHEEEHLEDVIDSKNSEDITGGLCFAMDNTRELDESDEKLCPIEEFDSYRNGMICASGELLLCSEQCLQEDKFDSNVEQCLQEDKFDSNVEQCLQKKITSEEYMEDCMIEEIHKAKQPQYEAVESRDFEDLGYKEDASHCDENGQHEELEESEEFFCHTPNKRQQGPVIFKELEGAELDVYDHQDGPKNDTVAANEEMLLCKDQCLPEEKFGLNLERGSQERTGLEQLEDFKDNVTQECDLHQCQTVDCSHFEGLDCIADEVKTGEQRQHETDDSRDFEDKDYKGQGNLELKRENINSAIKEESQQEPADFKELESTEIYVHDHQDKSQSDIVNANEEMLLCKEQCLENKKFELNVEQFSQERTDSKESDDSKDRSQSDIVNANEEMFLCKEQCLENEKFKLNVEQFSQERTDSKESDDSKDRSQSDIVNANEEMLLCKEQCLENKKFELNVEQFSQERTDSKESDDSKDNTAHKGLNCSSKFEGLAYKGGVCHSDDSQHRESNDLKDHLCPIEEQSSSEKNQSKEMEYAEAGMHVHQDEQNEIVLNEHFVLEEEFESNVNLFLQKRPESNDLEDSKADITHKVEEYDDETFDSKHLSTTNHCDETGRLRELEHSEEELKCADIDLLAHQDEHKNEIVVAGEEMLLSKEQCLQEEKFESNMEQCLQETNDSKEELENCVADLAHNGEQRQYETVNFMDFESSYCKEGASYWDEKGQNGKVQELEETFGQIKEQIQQETVKEAESTANKVHINYNRQQNFVVDLNEKVLPCKEQCPQEEKFEYNIEDYLRERIELEEVANCKTNEAHDGEQYQYDATDSNNFVVLDHKECENHADESCEDEEITDSGHYLSPHKEQFQEETVKDGCHNQIVAVYEQVLLSEEQSLAEGTFESLSENWQQEMAGSEELKIHNIDVAHEVKHCQWEAIDSREFVDLGEGASNKNGSCQYGEINSKEFKGFNEGQEKEKSESIRANSKEDVDKDISSENNLQLGEENPKHSLESIEDMSDMDVSCEESIVDSNEKEDIKGDALICEEEHKEETLDSTESQTFVQDAHQGSEEVISKLEELDLTEDVVPIIQEHSQKEIADSIDKLDSFEDLNLKSKIYQRKMSESEPEVVDDLHVSGDGMSDMDVQCKESTIDSADSIDRQDSIEDLSHKQCQSQMSESEVLENLHISGEGMSDMDAQCEEEDALICQEESLDSIDSQTSFQDAHVESGGSREVINKFEDLDLTEETMPITQEDSQKETADSMTKLDSVEDLSLENRPCEGKMSDSEVLDKLHISAEEGRENTIVLEELEQSEKVHLSKEQCQQNMVDAEETIDLENVNQYKQPRRMHVNGEESEYSISNALNLKGLCPNENVEPKDLENEDPQTKPKGVDTNESEYSSGDALFFEEKNRRETTDKAANEDYKQDPEDSPELEGFHTNKSENSTTLAHSCNGKKEVNQDMSTATVSCKLVCLSREIQAHKESTDNETDTVMKSDSGAVANQFSVKRRVKSGSDGLHPPHLDSTAEDRFHLAQFPRNLMTRIKPIVCLFAFAAFLFLCASKLVSISISAYAI